MDKRSSAAVALIALISASIGGTAFLRTHHNPTLRDVFLACEKGDLSGVVCCEDMLVESCGPVSPQNHDPLGIRAKEEDAYDRANKAP